MASRLSFGVKTSQSNLAYDQISSLWREADELPELEHAWLWDHLVPFGGDLRAGTLEAWTLLGALAAQTSRLRLGVLVTSNRIRPPAVLAKIAATVDVISGGRLEFGIGAGGAIIPGSPANELIHREYGAYGIEVVPMPEARAALRETLEICKLLWSQSQPFDFAGEYYGLVQAICEPKPLQQPHPPITIGVGNERTSLRIVAEHADIWSAPSRTIDDYRRKSEALEAHCAAIGRDSATITRSKQLSIPADGAATVREEIVQLYAAGVRHFVLEPTPPWPPSPAGWLVEQVVKPARQAVGA